MADFIYRAIISNKYLRDIIYKMYKYYIIDLKRIKFII